MDDQILGKFINTLFVLLPDFMLTEEEIKARVEKNGFDGFIDDMNERFSDLLKTAKLLSMPGKGGR